ncbi:MAG TPA: 2-polyprenylphenol 6-hydroxylase [Rhizomicrobium sp.]|nr:2-polyprenylphenol 6-hydroxylase [Rhizomicrobium sp.]
MLRMFTDIARLWHAARTLARHDALLPQEFADQMPLSLKAARWIFGGGQTARAEGTPGLRLAKALESLGPAYIKLGQVLATRPDMVGDDVAAALVSLQDRLPPFSIEVARAAVADRLGVPLEQAFSSFSGPIAAASIAQVHRAETTDDPPRSVAVKVLRPGVAKEFMADVAAFAFAARVAERVSKEARRLRPMAVVDTLANSTALELDLRMEAAAASELAERTRNDHNFRVPVVDWNRTQEKILTTEWIDGIPIRDTALLVEAGHDPKKLAQTIIRCFLTQALRDGFFHADMHQGNLFVDEAGRLVAVDFGIMGRLDPPMRRFMAETLAGFLAKDYRRIAEVHFEYGFVPAHHPIDTFAQALRAVGEPIFGRLARDVSMARLLQQLFDTTRRFDMQLQPQLVLLQKTMMVVEGVARGLDPDFDIWEASRPVMEDWMIEQIGPQTRLREAASGFGAIGKLAHSLPIFLRNAETLSNMLEGGGLRLHPDTTRALAEAQLQRTRHVRAAIWLAAMALVVIAVAVTLH